MNDRKLLLAALIMGTVAMLGWVYTLFLRPAPPKLAFVRTTDLISGYKGTEESRMLSQQSAQEWKANLDTLRLDYRKAVDQYNKDYATLSVSERKDREGHLAAQEEQMRQYSAETQQNSRKSDEKLMQGVLAQISTFVEEYGKRKGYDVILGTTASGSLLYAEQGRDVTDDLLRELNQSYSGSHGGNAGKK